MHMFFYLLSFIKTIDVDSSFLFQPSGCEGRFLKMENDVVVLDNIGSTFNFIETSKNLYKIKANDQELCIDENLLELKACSKGGNKEVRFGKVLEDGNERIQIRVYMQNKINETFCILADGCNSNKIRIGHCFSSDKISEFKPINTKHRQIQDRDPDADVELVPLKEGKVLEVRPQESSKILHVPESHHHTKHDTDIEIIESTSSADTTSSDHETDYYHHDNHRHRRSAEPKKSFDVQFGDFLVRKEPPLVETIPIYTRDVEPVENVHEDHIYFIDVDKVRPDVTENVRSDDFENLNKPQSKENNGSKGEKQPEIKKTDPKDEPKENNKGQKDTKKKDCKPKSEDETVVHVKVKESNSFPEDFTIDDSVRKMHKLSSDIEKILNCHQNTNPINPHCLPIGLKNLRDGKSKTEIYFPKATVSNTRTLTDYQEPNQIDMKPYKPHIYNSVKQLVSSEPEVYMKMPYDVVNKVVKRVPLCDVVNGNMNNIGC